MKNNSIRTVVATGIGAALFIIIGMFVNIPIFGNTSIQLQYAVQALFSVIFGPITGFFMGFIGHALKDGIHPIRKYLMGLGTCKCYYRACNWSIQQKI